ncbi:hypothetical protein [Motilimonas pumila]|nr:hypothetical protein [Motilimonas pumila]
MADQLIQAFKQRQNAVNLKSMTMQEFSLLLAELKTKRLQGTAN